MIVAEREPRQPVPNRSERFKKANRLMVKGKTAGPAKYAAGQLLGVLSAPGEGRAVGATLERLFADPAGRERLWAFARYYDLAPLLYKRLKSAGLLEALPDRYRQKLEAAYHMSAFKVGRLLSEAARYYGPLVEAGAEPVVIKGGALVLRDLYEDRAERPMTDIDLLIREGSYEAARRIVGELGYRPSGILTAVQPHPESLKSPAGLVHEFHETPCAEANLYCAGRASSHLFDGPFPARALTGEAEEFSTRDGPLKAAGAAGAAAYLSHHLAQHHAFLDHLAPKACLDLTRLLWGPAPLLSLEEFLDRADGWGVGRSARSCLALSAALSPPDPAALFAQGAASEPGGRRPTAEGKNRLRAGRLLADAVLGRPFPAGQPRRLLPRLLAVAEARNPRRAARIALDEILSPRLAGEVFPDRREIERKYGVKSLAGVLAVGVARPGLLLATARRELPSIRLTWRIGRTIGRGG